MFPNKKMTRRGLIAPGKGVGGGKIAAAMSHTDRGEQATDEQASTGPGYSSPPSANTGIGNMRGQGSDIGSAQSRTRKGTGTRSPTDHGIRRSVSTPKQEPEPTPKAGRVQSAHARVRPGTARLASDKDVSIGPKIRGNTMKAGQTGRSLRALKYAVTGTQIPDGMEEGMGGVIRAAKGGITRVKAARGGRRLAPPMPLSRPMGGVGGAPGAMGMSPGLPRPAGGGFRPQMAKGGRVQSLGRIAALDAKLDKRLGESEAGEKSGGKRKAAGG
jgi:hypothetical protein